MGTTCTLCEPPPASLRKQDIPYRNEGQKRTKPLHRKPSQRMRCQLLRSYIPAVVSACRVVTCDARAQAKARGEAESAAVGVSLAGVQHPCMLGACAPEEIATLVQQVSSLRGGGLAHC